MPAVKYKKFPVASKSMKWNVSAARKRASKWASSDGSMDWDKMRQLHGWYDADDMETMAGMKLMHHDIVDGKPYLVPRGCYAAMGRLNQENTDIPDEDRTAVFAHLKKHYEDDMDEEAPDMMMSADVTPGDPLSQADKRQFAYWLSRVPIAFEMPEEGEEGAGDGRKRSKIQILKGGIYYHPWWDVMRMDRALMVRIVENFDKNVVNQQIHVDTDHCKEAPAQGWFERVWLDPGDPRLADEDDLNASLWALVRWTDLGVEHIEQEHYKYTSVEYWPEFKDNQGRMYGPTLTGTALTNIPFITGMAELTLNRATALESVAHERARAGGSTLAPVGMRRTGAEPRRTGAKLETRGRFTMAKLSEAITKVLAGIGFSQNREVAEDDVAQEFVDRVRAELGLEDDENVTDDGIVLALNAVFAGVREEAVKAAAAKVEKPVVEGNAKSAPQSTELSAMIMDAVEKATLPLRNEVLTLKSTVEQKEATVQELVARSQRIEAERDEDRFAVRFTQLVRDRKAVPAMRETLRKIWDSDQTLFEAHVSSLPARAEFAGPVGSDGVNEETSGETSDATRYYSEAMRLMREEKLAPKAALRRVRDEHPEWYNEHKIVTNRGGREIMQRREQARRMLMETRTS